MRLDPDTRLGAAALAVVVWLLDLVLRALIRTWRIQVIAGEETVAAVLAGHQTVAFCFWHNRILPATGFFVRRLLAVGADLTLVTSASRDGELAARFSRRRGARVVRGSTSRGGARAVRGVLRTVRRHGSSPVLVPDGPKGPPYRFKAGVVGLAQVARVPIVCLGAAAERAWVLRTWDRMLLPRPFSRVAVALGEPRPVPQGASERDLEAARRECEEELMALTRSAEAVVGARDPLAGD
ncbi:MAG TPA: DUF374 domain-containing protein [Thermoanaerobaculia bacterium]|nr:DUF374 domain-containing protein [Thermoanaerobaculia bacterium]